MYYIIHWFRNKYQIANCFVIQINKVSSYGNIITILFSNNSKLRSSKTDDYWKYDAVVCKDLYNISKLNIIYITHIITRKKTNKEPLLYNDSLCSFEKHKIILNVFVLANEIMSTISKILMKTKFYFH